MNKQQLSDPHYDQSKKDEMVADLHKSFAFLSRDEQKFEDIFLHDIQNGDAHLEEGKTFRDYIEDYAHAEKQEEIRLVAQYLGNEDTFYLLTKLMATKITEKNINAFGRFEKLEKTIDEKKASAYIIAVYGRMPKFRVKNRYKELLKDFLIKGGYRIPEPPAK